MGMSDDPMIIPVMFLIKGILSNIYSAGIAFVYTFCSKENVKFQFTIIVIFTQIFSKLIGNLGTYLY